MQVALCTVEEVPPEKLTEEVKLWARDVRGLSFEVEDILDDDFHVRARKRHGDVKWYDKILEVFSQAKARHEISRMIDIINGKAKLVAERRARYAVGSIVDKHAASSRTVDRRLIDEYRKASEIIGIDNSSADLISMLLPKDNDESDKKKKIVSVVGLAGLGKTTLARAVYDQLKSKFGHGAFVPVGQHPSVTKVFRDILIDLDRKEYTKSKYTALDERQLIDELRDFLRAKRYFVVIDDIWEYEHLEIIKFALNENNCGNRIIITTRNIGVAKRADEVYELQPLSYDNSRELFYTRFVDGVDKCPPNHVVESSDRILKKCGGVPLAIITMASLLVNKNEEECIEVCNSRSVNQDIKDDRHTKNIRYILSLSYNDLPHHLKTCLLYLSIFPEDYLIHKDSLIWMWIAEGFVGKKSGLRSFEVGEQYFHELINRSLIQRVDSEVHGIMDGCRVHDMVLDHIISISREKNFVSSDGTLSESSTRWLAPKNRELDLTRDTHVNRPQVRTFVALQCAINKWAFHPRLKLIRVLALVNCSFREGCHNLEHIGNLLHLRYLGIRDSWFEELPEGIGILKFLQTLNLESIGYPELPCSIGELEHLVCLRAQQLWAPDGVIWRLSSLEELQIRGPHKNDQSQRQFMKDLGKLSELRVLKIVSNQSGDMDEATQTAFMNSLGSLKKMQHLTLGDPMHTVHMNAWESALPCQDLRCLFLPYIRFPKLPSWINSADLPILSHLDIFVRDVDEQGLEALGRLPELCYLKLYTDGAATSNTEAVGCFQKLRSLVLRHSMVQSVANEDSSASFTICHIHRGMATGTSRKKEDYRVVAPAVAVMPNLEELEFGVRVKELMVNNVVSCEDLDLEYLPSLRRIEVKLWCSDAYADDVVTEEAALRNAVDVHPNRPTLQIVDFGKEYIKRRSDDDDSVEPRNEEDEEETA